MNNQMNIFQMLDMINGMGNTPDAMLQMLLQQNPQGRQTIEQLRNSSNGMSAEQIAKQLARQNGISEQQLMQLYNKIKKQNKRANVDYAYLNIYKLKKHEIKRRKIYGLF